MSGEEYPLDILLSQKENVKLDWGQGGTAAEVREFYQGEVVCRRVRGSRDSLCCTLQSQQSCLLLIKQQVDQIMNYWQYVWEIQAVSYSEAGNNGYSKMDHWNQLSLWKPVLSEGKASVEGSEAQETPCVVPSRASSLNVDQTASRSDDKLLTMSERFKLFLILRQGTTDTVKWIIGINYFFVSLFR